jgi:hypothetical protein
LSSGCAKLLQNLDRLAR